MNQSIYSFKQATGPTHGRRGAAPDKRASGGKGRWSAAGAAAAGARRAEDQLALDEQLEGFNGMGMGPAISSVGELPEADEDGPDHAGDAPAINVVRELAARDPSVDEVPP